MVSQPDPYPTSLAVRGAQSVVSSRSSRPHVSSRSKRYNRSHAGGTSYVPQNEFPIFSHSGDVEIIISAGGVENRYLLHRHTLVRCSGFFEASTSREWSKASVLPLPEPASRDLARIGEEGSGSGTASRGGNEVARPGADSPLPRRRWRYVLDPGTDGDDIPMLVQKEAGSGGNNGNNDDRAPAQAKSLFGGGGGAISNTPSVRNKPAHSQAHSASSFFRSVANLSLTHSSRRHQEPVPDIGADPRLSQADMDLLRDYDNLFRIFYNYPPVLDGVSIADAYVQCKSLLTLADQYDALAVCGPRVDHHLLQFRGRLWKQIAKYPVSYLRLGYLARSKVIFQEALIHVVGQWPAGERSIRQGLPEAVVDIIEDKVDELEETVARVEGRLFRLALTNSRGERVGPNTSYLDWLAVSLFRQWLADNTSPAPPPRQPPPPPSSSSDRDRRGPHHRHHSHNHHSTSSRDGGGSAAGGGSQNAVQAPAPASLASVGRTYRLLGSPSGSAYLGHDECKRFLKLTPDLYSRDNLRRFEKRVDELKAAAREVVRPLMGSGLELEHEIASHGRSRGDAVEVAAGVTSYLTCVRVYDRDLPWDVDEG
ncbi:hypothetical protein DL768_009453 [Monosporascus sp. mg162]|nr:hypothetical protein DL768_009453 [Monosporascus sp. mg162]